MSQDAGTPTGPSVERKEFLQQALDCGEQLYTESELHAFADVCEADAVRQLATHINEVVWPSVFDFSRLREIVAEINQIAVGSPDARFWREGLAHHQEALREAMDKAQESAAATEDPVWAEHVLDFLIEICTPRYLAMEEILTGEAPLSVLRHQVIVDADQGLMDQYEAYRALDLGGRPQGMSRPRRWAARWCLDYQQAKGSDLVATHTAFIQAHRRPRIYDSLTRPQRQYLEKVAAWSDSRIARNMRELLTVYEKEQGLRR